ncbi:MAG: hypothetical protein HYT36_01080 [Candidatus Staskawiczbacteria bacterium]|nr:hypothetical protein [Candidatus Staskawiczbacteria bacterium]
MKKQFLVEIPHTKEECMMAMDEMLGMGEGVLAQFVWGCQFGEHKGWAIIDEDSPEEALKNIPSFLRDKARAQEVSEITKEQLKTLHE